MKKLNILFLALAAGLLLFTAACSDKKVDHRATLKIVTAPAKAKISIDDQKVGESPLTCKLPAGTYLVRADASGYETQWKNITVEPDSNVACEMALERLTSGVLIVSLPKNGAEVSMNGRVIGKTPLVLSGLEAGKYSAFVKAPKHTGVNAEWEIVDETPVLCRVMLSSNVGTLTVNSVPEADVYIDGELLGHTPVEQREIEAGFHEMTVQQTGYAKQSKKIHIEQDTPLTQDIVLEELPSSFQISTTPDGAEITLDGKVLGITPLLVENLKSGEHELSLAMDKYDTINIKPVAAPGQVTPVHVDMASSFGTVEFVTIPAGITVYVDGKESVVTEPDPETKGASKPCRIAGMTPGVHQIIFTHPLAYKPILKTVTVNKNEITPLDKPVEVWLKTHIIKLKSGETREVRVLFKNKEGVRCEPRPGLGDFYKHSEILSIEPIKGKK